MADRRVWFITGAGRGMGVDIAKAALDAGHAVVATGRDTGAAAAAAGQADDLPVVELDITMSSTAGIVGQAFCPACAASKFGLEGWMESLRFEVEPFGIRTELVPQVDAYRELSSSLAVDEP